MVPLVSELRPITLLNADYKFLSKILANRILKVLPSVIKSVQSSCVAGANICSSAFNLVSLIQKVESIKAQAAILSLDIFKAFDRTNLLYLEKVLIAMNFDKTFISWILLLHDGAKTRLLLCTISELIDVDFSVRQGDCIALILFILNIEPLLLCIAYCVTGFALTDPLVGHPTSVLTEGAVEKEEGFVDDTQVIVINDAEILEVEAVVSRFEKLSGTILNRDKKSKIMGLGSWKARMDWPGLSLFQK